MFDNRKVCGTCLYHKRLDYETLNRDGTLYDKTEDWVCTCERSDNNAYETEYTDTCDEWEGRE